LAPTKEKTVNGSPLAGRYEKGLSWCGLLFDEWEGMKESIDILL